MRAVRLDDLQRHQDVVDRAQPRQHGRVLKRHTDDLDWFDDRTTVDDDLALRRLAQAGRKFQERRLSATARANDGDKLAALERHIGLFKRER